MSNPGVDGKSWPSNAVRLFCTVPNRTYLLTLHTPNQNVCINAARGNRRHDQTKNTKLPLESSTEVARATTSLVHFHSSQPGYNQQCKKQKKREQQRKRRVKQRYLWPQAVVAGRPSDPGNGSAKRVSNVKMKFIRPQYDDLKRCLY